MCYLCSMMQGDSWPLSTSGDVSQRRRDEGIDQSVDTQAGVFTYTGNDYLEGLIQGGRWVSSANPPDSDSAPSDVTITIEYLIRFPSSWASYEITALKTAMDAWEAVANLEFVEEDSLLLPNPEVIYQLVNDPDSTDAGSHQFPEEGIIEWLTGGEHRVGEFNQAGGGWNEDGLTLGGFSFYIMLHELGHGLGLAHPHDYGGSSTIFPGVSSSSFDYGDHDLNQSIYTVMSYNPGWPGRYPIYPSYDYGWQATPMALDIAAIQEIYGANMNHNTGDDTYTLPLTNDLWRPPLVYYPNASWTCIWDAGGTDTLSATGASVSCTIDLRAATLEGAGAGGYISYVDGILGGFTIANNVVIENAIGGSGDDTIISNAANNRLTGGAGDDVFVFLDGFGSDVITDFNVNDDAIRFLGLREVTDFAGFLAASSQNGADVVYDYGDDGVNVLRLSNVQLSALSADNFRPSILTPPGGYAALTPVRLGSELTLTNSNSDESNVATLTSGALVAVWQSYREYTRVDGTLGRVYNIRAQRYDQDGVAQGGDFLVSSQTTTGSPFDPSVAALNNGGFVVVWADITPSGNTNNILLYAQFYDASGSASGSPVELTEYQDNNQHDLLSVATLENADSVVTWSVGDDIHGQRFNASDNSLGKFALGTSNPADPRSQHQTIALDGGGFIIVWTSGGNIYGQRFSAQNTKQGGEISINAGTAKTQFMPSVTALDGGGFIVVWQSDKDSGEQWNVYGRRFNADGTANGGDFRINT